MRSWHHAWTRSEFDAVGFSSTIPASASPRSSTGRFSGGIWVQRLTHRSSSGSRGALTSALRERTVPAWAWISQYASLPLATLQMISALRAVITPCRTASRMTDNSRSRRASRSIFAAVLPLIPSSSRA